MKKTIILVVLICGLVIVPNSAFTQDIKWADIYITPNGDPSIVGGYLGGDGQMNSANNWIDWSIGNKVPHSGTETDDVVISTCEGDFMNSGDWKERMRITKDGNVGIGTTSPSEKLEVSGKIKANNIGSIFIRWGNASCPTGATSLYSGFGFNEHYTQTGGSAEPICVKPGDPGATGPGDKYGDLLYPLGTGDVLRMPPGITATTEVKCAVCYVEGPVFELWGSSTCPTGWTAAYTGYGMGAYYAHTNQANRHCVDNVNYEGNVSNPNWGAIWYGTVMWDVKDLPAGYIGNTYVKCAMCYKQ